MTRNNPEVRNTRALVESLLDPAAYPDPVSGMVTHISTHISDVFLAGGSAYKVKKPVDFGFCDFSTPESRRRFSEREVELNKRLCNDVYLAVEPVNFDRKNGRYSIGGDGEQVDWTVKMRRLDADDQLDRLLESGDAGPGEIDRIARLLAEFHAGADLAPERFATLDAVAEIVLGNLRRVSEHAPRELDPTAFACISAYSNAFIKRRGSLIEARHAARMPRMCHGDLHAGNIFFEKHSDGGERTIQVIDCIEFNDELIYIDPAADIAFLSMDLKRRGYDDLSALLIESYAGASGDSGLSRLLPFYESYRAMVRCLAASISAEQSEGSDRRSHVEDANGYLRLACSIVAADAPLFAAITCGVTGTGKSTVAELIASQLGAVHLRTDAIRRELAGVGPTDRTATQVQGGIYSAEMSRRTYEEMFRRAQAVLRGGRSVIMDGTHLSRYYRQGSLDAGRDTGAMTMVIACSVPRAEAIDRLESRYASGRSESEGRPEVYEHQLPDWEPPGDDEAAMVIRINTGGVREQLPERVFTALWDGVLSA